MKLFFRVSLFFLMFFSHVSFAISANNNVINDGYEYPIFDDSVVVPGTAIITLNAGYEINSLEDFQENKSNFVMDLKHIGVLNIKNLETNPLLVKNLQLDTLDIVPAFMENTYKVVYPVTMDASEIIYRLSLLPEVKKVQPNYVYSLDAVPSDSIENSTPVVPNDTHYSKQWGLRVIGVENAWSHTKGDSDIYIAVIDTGVDLNHPDLENKLVLGWDYIDEDFNPDDLVGHGTHVAGIIGASTNNNLDVAGVTWNSKIFVQRACIKEYCDTQAIVRAIIDAANHPLVRVINLSFGSYNFDPLLKEAIKYAYQKNKLVVASAGNDNISDPHYPSSYENVISVAAVDESFNKASFSNFGTSIDISAPGVNILSTYFNDIFILGRDHNTKYKSGTSMATPFVAGVAALIYSSLPEDRRNVDVVNDILLKTADDLGNVGYDPFFGFGIVNAEEAVNATIQPPYLSLKVWRYTAYELRDRSNYLVRVRDHDSHKLVFEKSINIDPSGIYSELPLAGLNNGYYDVYLYNYPFLSRVYENIQLVPGNEHFIDFSEQGKYGDFNYDDEINAIDLDIFRKNYHNQVPYPVWIYDLNGDGILNYIDLQQFAIGYQKIGSDFPYYSQISTNVFILDQNDQTIKDGFSSSISLVPSSGSYSVGDQFDLQVLLNTGGETVSASNVRIRYDSTAFEVLSITNGNVFAGGQESIYNSIEKGEISFLNGNQSQPFNGIGTLFTIRLKVKAGNTSSGIWVYYKTNETNDSNVVSLSNGEDITQYAGFALFNLYGSPSREIISGTLLPTSNSYITVFDSDLILNLGMSSIVASDSVKFEVFYDGDWQLISEDTNSRNGWRTDWNNAHISDQNIAFRATISDINQKQTVIQTSNILLDRIAPTTTLTIPQTIPSNQIVPIIWSSIDNLSGVNQVEVQTKVGANGTWDPLVYGDGFGWINLALVEGELTSIRVRAKDNAGNWSSFSREEIIGNKLFLPLLIK